MKFSNARRILRAGFSVGALKLLLLQCAVSRPTFRGLCVGLLRVFVRDGSIAVRYPCHGRTYTVFIRMDEMESDLYTVKELAPQSVYDLEPGFEPDLIVDGGGNVGLFSLLASAVFPASRIVVCEPVPRSIAQIEKHLKINGVRAEILPVCLGGHRRTIPFYIREAIGSSFDPEKPYTSKIDVEVLTLADVLEGRDAKSPLIKLDIEGMELEVLESYVPTETRCVFIVGELHGRKANGARLERIFKASGWTLRYRDDSETDSIFAAWSPAASPTAPPERLVIAS